MCRGMLVLLVMVVSAGCGTSRGPAAAPLTVAPSGQMTPAQVHAAWVAAMRDHDRTALLQLAADTELQTFFVDDHLRSVQERLRLAPDGALARVELRDPREEGMGQAGVSLWHLRRKPSATGRCWQPRAARGK